MQINPISGSFVKTAELENGKRAKITTEAQWVTTDFKYDDGNPKQQLQAKAKFEGKADEYKVNLNKVTREGLIKAFGNDTNDWIGRTLTIHTDKANVGGKNVRVLFLIPEGYVLGEDENNYNVIVPKEKAMAPKKMTIEEDTTPLFDDADNTEDMSKETPFD